MNRAPERLMLEALQFAQKLRLTEMSDKDEIRAWREFDALAAEAIAALAKHNQPHSEERKAELKKIGDGLGYILGMKPDLDEKERWYTRWGTKTGLGLVLTIERFVLHLQGNLQSVEHSMADECRAVAAEGQKLFDAAGRRKAQRDRSAMTQEAFYKERDNR